MPWTSRDRDLKRLERELGHEGYGMLLRQAALSEPFLVRFNSWFEVVAFMGVGASRASHRNVILLAMFDAYAKDGDPRWHNVLLVIFWPTLESIHRWKRHWDPFEPDQRWQNVLCAFLDTILRIDVERRSDRLASRIRDDTINRLYRAYKRGWYRLERERELPEDDMGDPTWSMECPELAAVDDREERDKTIEKLKQYRDDGVISESDFYLAVGVHVYRESLADYARKQGLPFERVKKSSQRLIAKIRRHERRI